MLNTPTKTAALAKLTADMQAAESKRLAGLQSAAAKDTALQVALGQRASDVLISSRDIRSPWAQDMVTRPVIPANATMNPMLASLARMHTSYVHEINLVNPASGLFEQSFFVELNRVFYICNVEMTVFDTVQSGLTRRPGFVTIRDNATMYSPVYQVPSQVLQCNSPDLSQVVNPPSIIPNDKQFRTILPIPYGISPGGSFTSQLYIPGYLPSVTRNLQIMIEGFWDFNFK